MTRLNAEYKRKSKALQDSAWFFNEQAKKAYKLGQFELASSLNKSYERLTQESIYFDQLENK